MYSKVVFVHLLFGAPSFGINYSLTALPHFRSISRSRRAAVVPIPLLRTGVLLNQYAEISWQPYASAISICSLLDSNQENLQARSSCAHCSTHGATSSA